MTSTKPPSAESRIELVTCWKKYPCSINSSPVDGCRIVKGCVYPFDKEGKDTGITFCTYLVAANLSVDGLSELLTAKERIFDEFITRRTEGAGPISLTTHLSLTCTNCPDDIQA